MNTNSAAAVEQGKTRKHRSKKLLGIIISLGLVLALAVGAVSTSGFGLLNQHAQAEGSGYQVLQLTTGNITKSVTGTGSLAMDDTQDVTIPAGVEVATVDVKVGQSVQQGQALATLDAQSIQDQIDTLNDELTTINSTLTSLSGDTASAKVKATVEGRIKTIYGQAGDDVASVMKQYGALMVLSVDGYMKLEVALGDKVAAIGDTVKVQLSDKTTIDGTVTARNDNAKSMTVLISDKKADVGESVSVYDSYGNLLGSATAQINNALRITGNVGTIDSIQVSEDSAVSANTTLCTLENLPISQEYRVALAQREDTLADIAQMENLLEKPVITATANGIVNAVGVTKGQTLTEDAAIVLTTRQAIALSVNVDELDILSVSEGMSAAVTLDAIPNETFQGKVTWISASGTTSNNVTTYPVEISLKDDTRFMPGMSASANIVVKDSGEALLVPVSALNTARGETYVYTYTGTLPEDGTGDPGTKTVITTGISDDNYAQVLSGLTANQQVVVAQSAGTTSTASNKQEGNAMGGMMMMGGGAGAPPSGDRQGPPSR